VKNARKWSLNLRAKKSVESLIIKVENDEPLKGRCQVCPEVDYASEQKENPTLNLDIKTVQTKETASEWIPKTPSSFVSRLF